MTRSTLGLCVASATIRQQIMEVLSDPMNLPAEFWQYDVQNWVKEAPVFPISQVFGFSQFTANAATTIQTNESTTSVFPTYVDLATVGPTLTGLADGKYVIFWGAGTFTSVAGNDTLCGPSVNGGAVLGNARNGGTNSVSVTGVVVTDLSNGGSNSITIKYCVAAAATGSFFGRWLIALRYGNL